MTKKNYPTKDELHQLFEYKNGMLFWKVNRFKNILIGKQAGYLSTNGYRYVAIDGSSYFEHRIVFMMHYGFLVKSIDHINGLRSDNRIENLRPATNQQNGRNQAKRITNTSGQKNVCWDKSKGKWAVRLRFNGKQNHIGRFYDFELAELVAIEARDKFHREFANHE